MKRKSIIFVHGIGPQPDGYSNALWDILWRGAGPANVAKYELQYSDIFEKMNAKSEMGKTVTKYGLDRVVGKILKDKNLGTAITQKASDILENTVSHVSYFLLFRDARNAILNRFRGLLVEVVEDGLNQKVFPPDLELTVISHSLGTVVAYMGLHLIVGEDGLGLQDDLKIRNFFMFASPLGLIRKVSTMSKMAKLPHIAGGVRRPIRWNSVLGLNESNVVNWYSYRNSKDLVASLVPLAGDHLDSSKNLPYVFDAIHVGNAHSFENYMEQAREQILSVA